MKILILENDLIVFNAISAILVTHGFRVYRTCRIHLFWDLYLIKADLVLISHMENDDYSFIKLCQLIKANSITAKIPILLTSESTKLKDLALESNADGFIYKPLDMEDLINTIKDMLSL